MASSLVTPYSPSPECAGVHIGGTVEVSVTAQIGFSSDRMILSQKSTEIDDWVDFRCIEGCCYSTSDSDSFIQSCFV